MSLGAALSLTDDRGGTAVGPVGDSGLSAPGVRVHAATLRRQHSVYADDLPGISVTEAGRILQTQDKILRSFPEVQTVFGKAGRAETSTDPAPLSMMETTHCPQARAKWRAQPLVLFSVGTGLAERHPAHGLADHISHEQLVSSLAAGRGAKIPGTTNALDHADQSAHRHAIHGESARRSASRSSVPISSRSGHRH